MTYEWSKYELNKKKIRVSCTFKLNISKTVFINWKKVCLPWKCVLWCIDYVSTNAKNVFIPKYLDGFKIWKNWKIKTKKRDKTFLDLLPIIRFWEWDWHFQWLNGILGHLRFETYKEDRWMYFCDNKEYKVYLCLSHIIYRIR